MWNFEMVGLRRVFLFMYLMSWWSIKCLNILESVGRIDMEW